jgi:hypothetical protein
MGRAAFRPIEPDGAIFLLAILTVHKNTHFWSMLLVFVRVAVK